MRLLRDRIERDGVAVGSDIIKVDSFLNHMVDPLLVDEIGAEFVRIFGEGATKVLTVESSGISVAFAVARLLGLPFIYAKKYGARNQDPNLYESEIYSYTRDAHFTIRVAKSYLSAGDRVLIIDDFLAVGGALGGLIDIVGQSGAELIGCGIVIEKTFQDGGRRLREKGIRVESLAKISGIEDGRIVFWE